MIYTTPKGEYKDILLQRGITMIYLLQRVYKRYILLQRGNIIIYTTPKGEYHYIPYTKEGIQ